MEDGFHEEGPRDSELVEGLQDSEGLIANLEDAGKLTPSEAREIKSGTKSLSDLKEKINADCNKILEKFGFKSIEEVDAKLKASSDKAVIDSNAAGNKPSSDLQSVAENSGGTAQPAVEAVHKTATESMKGGVSKEMRENFESKVSRSTERMKAGDYEGAAKIMEEELPNSLKEEAKLRDGKTGKPGSFEKLFKYLLVGAAILGSIVGGLYAWASIQAAKESGCFWYYGNNKQPTKVLEGPGGTSGPDIELGWCACSNVSTLGYPSVSADCSSSGSDDMNGVLNLTAGAATGKIIPHCLAVGGKIIPNQGPPAQPNSSAVGLTNTPWCNSDSPASDDAISYRHVIVTPEQVITNGLTDAVNILTSPFSAGFAALLKIAMYIGLAFVVLIVIVLVWRLGVKPILFKKSYAPVAAPPTTFGRYFRRK